MENSDYIGGNYVGALNLSTTLPGILTTVENIDFSYFIDFANVWGVDYDSSIDDSFKIRSSTGVGLDFLTPVGPLSFSLSKPITKKSSDKTEGFRFNLGTTF
jgi:outer membrane protein insertion porin family